MATFLSPPYRSQNKEIYSQLECPICLDTYTAPILMCSNGHNVCHRCQKTLLECPICHEHRPFHRNIALEQMISVLLVPCKFADGGCHAVIKRKEMPAHEEICMYGLRCRIGKCKWVGSEGMLASHFNQYHRDKIISFDNKVAIAKLLSSHLEGEHKLVYSSQGGKWFWVCMSIVREQVRLYVRYIGPQNMAAKYLYKIKVGTNNEQRALICKSVAVRMYENMEFRNKVENLGLQLELPLLKSFDYVSCEILDCPK